MRGIRKVCLQEECVSRKQVSDLMVITRKRVL